MAMELVSTVRECLSQMQAALTAEDTRAAQLEANGTPVAQNISPKDLMARFSKLTQHVTETQWRLNLLRVLKERSRSDKYRRSPLMQPCLDSDLIVPGYAQRHTNESVPAASRQGRL